MGVATGRGADSDDPGDSEILATAHQQGRVLVTLDKDFGELATFKLVEDSLSVEMFGVMNPFDAISQADYYALFARTGEGSKGISCFVGPGQAEGLSFGKPEEKMGLRSSRTAQIYFSECRVPVENLLGEEGQGLKIALATLDHSRLGIAAQAVGIHQRALELAVSYTKERVQFGVPIAQHQAMGMLNLRSTHRAVAGGGPGPEGDRFQMNGHRTRSPGRGSSARIGGRRGGSGGRGGGFADRVNSATTPPPRATSSGSPPTTGRRRSPFR